MSLSPDDLIEVPDALEILERGEEVELTPEEEDFFYTLSQIGKKEKTIQFWGHSAIITTLNNAEEIAIGFVLQPFKDLPTLNRAYKSCVVAASLKELDGEPVYHPLKTNTEPADIIRAKFNIINEYTPIVVDKLYDEISILLDEVINLWSKLGKASS